MVDAAIKMDITLEVCYRGSVVPFSFSQSFPFVFVYGVTEWN